MSFKNLCKKYTPEELADAFVFRSTLSPEEEILASEQLKLARFKLRENTTNDQYLYAIALQERFRIEDSITQTTHPQ